MVLLYIASALDVVHLSHMVTPRGIEPLLPG